VAIVTCFISSGAAANARPMSSSERPQPYKGAVSSFVIPLRAASWRSATTSAADVGVRYSPALGAQPSTVCLRSGSGALRATYETIRGCQ